MDFLDEDDNISQSFGREDEELSDLSDHMEFRQVLAPVISHPNSISGHLSDFFDEDAHLLNLEVKVQELTLDEIPYDRDIKYVNVAVGSRPKAKMDKRQLRQLHNIATENLGEFSALNEHYKSLDAKKREFDASIPAGIHRRPHSRRQSQQGEARSLPHEKKSGRPADRPNFYPRPNHDDRNFRAISGGGIAHDSGVYKEATSRRQLGKESNSKFKEHRPHRSSLESHHITPNLSPTQTQASAPAVYTTEVFGCTKLRAEAPSFTPTCFAQKK